MGKISKRSKQAKKGGAAPTAPDDSSSASGRTKREVTFKPKGITKPTKREKKLLKEEALKYFLNSNKERLKELKARKKRKNVSVIGDTNPLYDALAEVETTARPRAIKPAPKGKATQKASKRKKESIEAVKFFGMVLKNDRFKKNPGAVISEHVKAFAQANTKP